MVHNQAQWLAVNLPFTFADSYQLKYATRFTDELPSNGSTWLGFVLFCQIQISFIG
jgi:uncharacterized membrane protein